MATGRPDAIKERQKFIEAWNTTMVKIWKERINLLGVVDTKALLASPVSLPVKADGRFLDLAMAQSFLEYGIWQDLGVGREVPIGNGGDIGREKVRERRRWYSTAYFSSVMNLRDFLAESIGKEFVGMFTTLEAEDLRKHTEYYKRKGLS